MFTPPGTGGRVPGRRTDGRAHRRPLLVLLAMVVTAALVAGSGYVWWTGRPTTTEVATTPRVRCPAPGATPVVVVPSDVRVNVYNATDTRGLAATVAGKLRKRGFTVKRVDNDPLDRTVTGAAEVRSSARGQGAARTVAAQVAPAGQVGAAADVPTVADRRANASVDLVLGAAWNGLRPPADAANALTPSPEPVPAGC